MAPEPSGSTPRSARSKWASRRTSPSFPPPSSTALHRPPPPCSPSSPGGSLAPTFRHTENPASRRDPQDRPLADRREPGAAARAPQGRGVRRHAGDAVARHPGPGPGQGRGAGRWLALRSPAGHRRGDPAAAAAAPAHDARVAGWRRSLARAENAGGERPGARARARRRRVDRDHRDGGGRRRRARHHPKRAGAARRGDPPQRDGGHARLSRRRAGATHAVPLNFRFRVRVVVLNIVSTGDTVKHARLVTALASSLTLAVTAVAAPRMALAQTASGSATERLYLLPPDERAAGRRLLFRRHSTIGRPGV